MPIFCIKFWQLEHFFNCSDLMLPDIMSVLFALLSALTEMAAIANKSDSFRATQLMHRTRCQTSSSVADWWKHGDCCTDCSNSYRHIYHLLLWHGSSKSLYVATTAPLLFLIGERTWREGEEEDRWLRGEGGGTDPAYVLSPPFAASYISLYFCPLVMPVRLWCEVMVCSGLGQRLAAIQELWPGGLQLTRTVHTSDWPIGIA